MTTFAGCRRLSIEPIPEIRMGVDTNLLGLLISDQVEKQWNSFFRDNNKNVALIKTQPLIDSYVKHIQ